MGHAWHVGALSGLAEATGWDPRSAGLIVGTSAGAVLGAELRAGHHPTDLLHPGVGAAPIEAPLPVLARRSYRPAAPGMVVRRLRSRPSASLGLVAAGLVPRGRRSPAIVAEAIERLMPAWPPGLWVCTTRLADGARVVLTGDEGVDLATAVAASCAMAGFFTPVTIQGVDHVDGGSGSVTNADVVGDVGLDVVVVSSPMSLDGSRRGDACGIAARVARRRRLSHRARLLAEVAPLRSRGAHVVVLEPGADDVAALGGIGAAMDFGRRAAAAEQARASTLRRLATAAYADATTVLSTTAARLSSGPPGIP